VLPPDRVASEGGGAVKGRRVRLVTVAGDGASADVVVAADIPVGELRPVLARLLGGRPRPEDPRWMLVTAAGAVLRPAATLHDQQVQDGEVLHLRVGRPPDPRPFPRSRPMPDLAWQPDPPSPTPAPVDRRFGAATLGRPDPRPVPPAWSADRGEVTVRQVRHPIPAGKHDPAVPHVASTCSLVHPTGGSMARSTSGAGLGMAAGKARLPPRWFVVTVWHLHRWIVRVTGARRGLWPPRPGRWGTLRLTVRGRRSGEPRSVIVGYYEDGPNLVTMAMNGWGAAEPAWWLNLQAHPEAVVELAGGIRREVLGRAAVGEERERLWRRWHELNQDLDGYAARRPQGTAVVVLEPRLAAD
jgi:F420H(2)-dependent quinone reductase